MRIAHIVNVVDDVGSYGGPLRVALNQVRALRERGHDATLVAGATGPARTRPEPVTGDVPVRLHRSMNVGGSGGFATRWAPGVHWWLVRNARRLDAVQVHLGRDLTTAPAAALLRLLRVPYVVQTHGMVDPSSRRLATVLDALLVRFVLRGAASVLVLTEKERDDVSAVMRGAPLPFAVVPNGVALHGTASTGTAGTGTAGTGTAGTVAGRELVEVLFLSRLHERKRPLNFVRAARTLREKDVRARFTLVGPDEGELPAVRAAIIEAADPEGLISYEGAAPMSGSVDRIAAGDVFVLPSVAEPFPMAVVEAMSAGVPVICSDSCGLAPLVEQAGAGIVVPDEDVTAIADAILTLVSDPAQRRACGEHGRELVASTLSIEAVAGRLEALYAAAGRR